jgi:hypothetical protein
VALVVEDGTIVSGANSFATLAYANAYLSARGVTKFADADQGDQETALVRACDYLRDEVLFIYRGQRVAYNQPLPWPRQGASIYRGPSIPNNVIPQGLIDAQCELCFKALTADLQPDIEHGGGISSERIGPISTSYFEHANPRILITAIMGLIQPLLLGVGPIGLLPTVYHTDAATLEDLYPFDPTNFRIPNSVDPTPEVF